MTSVPLISVFNIDDPNKVLDKHIALPAVFRAPIRPDIVGFVHQNLARNRRQAHGVYMDAGMQHSAASWGTGRAVARIPRVSGSGTHRSGQGAFGNMCRKGRMFAPLRTWRRWHRRVNIKQKRHAAASAIAASGIVPLVLARGHRINNVPQIPLVVEDRLESYEKTRDAVAFLKRIGGFQDVQKVVNSKSIRAGHGKFRGKRYRVRKGPLIVYFNENAKLLKAFRNIPGVEVVNVNRLNLLQLAPGGQLGRFIIWTQSAFASLNTLFGTYRYESFKKSGYTLLRPLVTNPDLAKIINSNQIQEVLQKLFVKPAKTPRKFHGRQRQNLLTNTKALDRVNPYAKVYRAKATQLNEENRKKNVEAAKAKKRIRKETPAQLKSRRQASNLWFRKVNSQLTKATQDAIAEEKEIQKKYFTRITEETIEN